MCDKCLDTGLVLEGCCSGYMCGCMGMPVKFVRCSSCGCDVVDYDVIRETYGEMSDYMELAI